MALLEEVCQWDWASGFNSLVPFPIYFLLPVCCLRYEFLPAPTTIMDSNALEAKAHFLLEQWFLML